MEAEHPCFLSTANPRPSKPLLPATGLALGTVCVIGGDHAYP